jgi:hypothetical protein
LQLDDVLGVKKRALAPRESQRLVFKVEAVGRAADYLDQSGPPTKGGAESRQMSYSTLEICETSGAPTAQIRDLQRAE